MENLKLKENKDTNIFSSFTVTNILAVIIFVILTALFAAGEILIYNNQNSAENTGISIEMIYLLCGYLIIAPAYIIHIVFTNRHVRNISEYNRKYRTVFDAVKSPVILAVRNRGIITFVNNAAVREFGNILNKNFSSFLNNNRFQKDFENLVYSEETGKYFKVENYPYFSSFKEPSDISETASNEYNFYILTDITNELNLQSENENCRSRIDKITAENESAQKQIKSDLLLKTEVMDCSDIMSCIIGFDGRILSASRSFIKSAGYTGYSEGKIINKNIFDFIDNINKSDILECKDSSNTIKKEGLLKNQNGSKTAVRANIFALQNENGVPSAVCVQLVDITEENEFKEKHNWFEAVIENSVTLTSVCDLNANFLYINPAVYKTLGYASEEAEKLSLKDYFESGYEKRFMSEALNLIKKGEIWHSTGILRHKDNSSVIIDHTAFPIKDGQNKPGRFINIMRNISDLAKTREHLKQEIKIQEFTSEFAASIGFFEDHDILFENVVRILGEFFGFCRVCTFKVSESENMVKCTHEWTARNLNNVNDTSKNTLLGKYEQYDRNDNRIKNILGSSYFVAEYNARCALELFECRDRNVYRIVVPIVINKKILAFISADINLLYPANSVNVPPRSPNSNSVSLSPMYMTKEKYIKTLRGIANICTNVFERKISDDILKETKKTLELIINNVPYSIFWKNTDSIYIGCNDKYLEFNGWEKEDIYGKSEFDLQSPKIAEMFIEEDREILKTRKEIDHRETRLKVRGKDTWVSASKGLIMNEKGEPFAILGIIEDITERKESEKTISETLAKFEAVVKNYPGGIWCINNERRFTVMEGLELHDMGLPSGMAAIGKKISDVLKNFPEMLERLNATFDTGPQNWTYTNPDGRSYNCSTSFIIGEDGSQVGIIGMSNDITEAVKIQGQLVEAMEKAENANKAKSEFLSRMSHEIRTPMNAIIGMTKIALSADNSQKMTNSLEKIDVASKQLLGIINDILDMSKIEAQKFDIMRELFDFEAMIERIYNLISVRTDEKNIKFDVDISGEIQINYVGDEMRLSQVIINLLGNSVKFTPNGGSMKLSAKIIKSVRDSDTSMIEFKISDTGIGISREQQARLFNSFEQADGTISRKYGGTGLGLAICKKIVELMGGDIHVESEINKGSTFIFTVKLENTDQQFKIKNISGENSGETVDFSKYNIILAEDVEVNREIVVSLLEDTRLNIDCAENGEEAYTMFSKNQDGYDLILMDIQMPVLDGYEATKMIRDMDSAKAKNIPIIAMTANAFKEDIDECKNAGMNDHIAKPIDVEILTQKIAEYLAYSKKVKTYINSETFDSTVNIPYINSSDFETESGGIKTVPILKLESEAAGKKVFSPEKLMPDINFEEGVKRLSGNKKLFISLMKSFKGYDLYDQLIKALQKDDISECVRLAHTLKGLGINLSMPVVYVNAMIIESHLKSIEYAEPEYLAQLKEALDAVAEKINMIAE
ncbi:MAG: PAS domain S-box protein [Oscillospiraceae bacterium]|nr:PAS domain S-box protein [Oscillospiraceae bacterium]